MAIHASDCRAGMPFAALIHQGGGCRAKAMRRRLIFGVTQSPQRRLPVLTLIHSLARSRGKCRPTHPGLPSPASSPVMDQLHLQEFVSRHHALVLRRKGMWRDKFQARDAFVFPQTGKGPGFACRHFISVSGIRKNLLPGAAIPTPGSRYQQKYQHHFIRLGCRFWWQRH